MIYGANGYTGRLVTEIAVAKGLKPVLAGRNKEAIVTMAKHYKLPYQICALDDKNALSDAVLGVNVVLHCAGPFVHTVKPMLEACLRNGTHYLDITGEIAVFEKLAELNEAITTAGIMAMSGVGFDVVPTDCLSLYLKEQLPSASYLSLAFMSTGGGVSHGTATTMLHSFDQGGAIRKNGVITKVPHAHKTRLVNFRSRRRPVKCVTIPWGDVATAYHSTGIPNIEVYTALGKWGMRFLELSEGMFGWLFKRDFLRNFIQNRINNAPAGPSARQRSRAQSYIWGEAIDGKGNKVTARLITPEGYTLTALTALKIVEKVLAGNAPIGYQTPAKAYGAGLILEIEGVSREDVSLQREISIE